MTPSVFRRIKRLTSDRFARLALAGPIPPRRAIFWLTAICSTCHFLQPTWKRSVRASALAYVTSSQAARVGDPGLLLGRSRSRASALCAPEQAQQLFVPPAAAQKWIHPHRALDEDTLADHVLDCHPPTAHETASHGLNPYTLLRASHMDLE